VLNDLGTPFSPRSCETQGPTDANVLRTIGAPDDYLAAIADWSKDFKTVLLAPNHSEIAT
jgi:hypothetical protein